MQKLRFTASGDIAQLARALVWHTRGPGFESPYLHHNCLLSNTKPTAKNTQDVKRTTRQVRLTFLVKTLGLYQASIVATINKAPANTKTLELYSFVRPHPATGDANTKIYLYLLFLFHASHFDARTTISVYLRFAPVNSFSKKLLFLHTQQRQQLILG